MTEKVLSTEQYLKTLPNSGEDFIVKKAAEARVQFDPLPGPMAEAIDINSNIEVKTSVGVVNVRKLVAYDITLFKKFNSPFYQQMLEAQKNPNERSDIEYQDEDSYSMVFQFINPPLVVKKVADKGKEYFDNIALEQISLIYNLSDLKLIIDAICNQIIKSFSTLVQHGAEEKSGLDNLVEKYAENDDQKEIVKKK